MDKEPQYPKSKSCHQHEFGASSTPTSLQWPHGLSFRDSLMQPLDQSRLFNPFDARHQGSAPFSGAFATHPSPNAHMELDMQEQHDHSQQENIEVPSQCMEENVTGGRATNWSIIEDTRLCNAWVKISTDPVTGSSQKNITFWNRVFNDFLKQHGENEVILRTQKGCEARMQHIKGQCNKWSAAIQKVQDSPRSGENELMVERATHAFFRMQNGDKAFKLEHCWAILSKCAKFTQMLRPTTNTKDAAIDGIAVEEETPQYSIPAPIHMGSHDNSGERETRETCVGARPLGRKRTKELRRAKRQASSEAQSVIGEKVTKKLDELTTASSLGWQRATELHEEEVRCSIKRSKMQIIREKMTFEKEMIIAEKQLYELDRGVFGSPSDVYKVAVARKNRLVELQAEYDAFIEGELNSAPSNSVGVPSQSGPSTSSFDEEANV